MLLTNLLFNKQPYTMISVADEPLKNDYDIIIKRKITQKYLDRINNEVIDSNIKANNLKQSFFNRFLKSKSRNLYFKTIKQQNIRSLEILRDYFSRYVKKNMQRLERRIKFKRKITGNFSNFVPMAYRAYCYIKVFVTHKRKNTFITIFRGEPDDETRINHFKQKVINKFSCGVTGYKGPKKSTVFARKEVIKDAGNYLGSLMTTLVSIFFTTRVKRWNRKTIRNLCPNLSYILKIHINYKRSHGKKKYKNRRRI